MKNKMTQQERDEWTAVKIYAILVGATFFALVVLAVLLIAIKEIL